jgi:hypothetical protein
LVLVLGVDDGVDELITIQGIDGVRDCAVLGNVVVGAWLELQVPLDGVSLGVVLDEGTVLEFAILNVAWDLVGTANNVVFRFNIEVDVSEDGTEGLSVGHEVVLVLAREALNVITVWNGGVDAEDERRLSSLVILSESDLNVVYSWIGVSNLWVLEHDSVEVALRDELDRARQEGWQCAQAINSHSHLQSGGIAHIWQVEGVSSILILVHGEDDDLVLEFFREDETRGSALQSQSWLEADLLRPQLLLEVEVLLRLQLVVSGAIEEFVLRGVECRLYNICVASTLSRKESWSHIGVVVVKARVGILDFAIFGVVKSGDDQWLVFLGY